MAKKKVVKKKLKKERKTRIQFLRELYKRDPLIANDKALKLLLAAFSMSKATTKSIITWKNMLRAEGMNIPKQREKGKKKKKVVKRKKK